MKTNFVNTDKKKKSCLGINMECEWGHRGIGSDGGKKHDVIQGNGILSCHMSLLFRQYHFYHKKLSVLEPEPLFRSQRS